MREEDLPELRDSTEEFHLVVTDTGSTQERIQSMQEEIAGPVSEENNRTLFVLTSEGAPGRCPTRHLQKHCTVSR